MPIMVTIDDKEVDFLSLPEASQIALAQRGVNHVLGNEVASRISAAKKATNEDGTLKYDEDGLEELEKEIYETKLKAIFEGTLGARAVGVTRDPLSKFKRQYAVEMVLKPYYASKGAKWPVGKGSGDIIAEQVAKVLASPKYADKAREYAEKMVESEKRIKESAKMEASEMEDLLEGE